MEAQKRSALLVALLIGAGVAVSGCNRPNSPDTASKTGDRYASPSSPSSSGSASMSPSTTATTPPSSTASDSTPTRVGEATEDTAITTKVKAAILAEPGLHSMDIGVDTRNAVVTLSGTVDSPPLKERAKQVASNVSGVRSVVDNLTAKSG